MNLRKKDIQMDKGSHSVYSLNYHLILVVKYRRKVIDDEISDKLKDIFIPTQENTPSSITWGWIINKGVSYG